MPSRKKKSKAKGRKPAAGKGVVKVEENNVTAEGTLNSEMQRLKISKREAGDEDDALLEEAIKLAAVEEQEMKVKEKENCTHGYNPSIFQKEFCEDYFKKYTSRNFVLQHVVEILAFITSWIASLTASVLLGQSTQRS